MERARRASNGTRVREQASERERGWGGGDERERERERERPEGVLLQDEEDLGREARS
jgi:hypothetical protein